MLFSIQRIVPQTSLTISFFCSFLFFSQQEALAFTVEIEEENPSTSPRITFEERGPSSVYRGETKISDLPTELTQKILMNEFIDKEDCENFSITSKANTTCLNKDNFFARKKLQLEAIDRLGLKGKNKHCILPILAFSFPSVEQLNLIAQFFTDDMSEDVRLGFIMKLANSDIKTVTQFNDFVKNIQDHAGKLFIQNKIFPKHMSSYKAYIVGDLAQHGFTTAEQIKAVSEFFFSLDITADLGANNTIFNLANSGIKTAEQINGLTRNIQTHRNGLFHIDGFDYNGARIAISLLKGKFITEEQIKGVSGVFTPDTSIYWRCGLIEGFARANITTVEQITDFVKNIRTHSNRLFYTNSSGDERSLIISYLLSGGFTTREQIKAISEFFPQDMLRDDRVIILKAFRRAGIKTADQINDSARSLRTVENDLVAAKTTGYLNTIIRELANENIITAQDINEFLMDIRAQLDLDTPLTRTGAIISYLYG